MGHLSSRSVLVALAVTSVLAATACADSEPAPAAERSPAR